LLFEVRNFLKEVVTELPRDYKDFSKAAMLNWLLKFGWSHPDPTFDKKYPTLSMDQMIVFNDGNISKNNCKIDRNKLLFLRKWKSIERRNVVKENIITDFDTFKTQRKVSNHRNKGVSFVLS
jgi:hypothetical protein